MKDQKKKILGIKRKLTKLVGKRGARKIVRAELGSKY